ncbi:MAG: Coenzyme F420 hydrogenase/dehydrogenase, beta subunit C-terminal domain [Bacteroidaceae bacterium]|nr:Coenzyme F420 hydrogenase/dehydrogenase, beta subunit C-terminal domain [Bacteroidaceae bacterium]
MIKIQDKKECCGCTACEQICPRRCISMKEDGEGFLYPVVDVESCVDCNLCEKVCPAIYPFTPAQQLPQSYACKAHSEDTRLNSSSGGMFTILACKVINMGGVVFGACFQEDWTIAHDFTETLQGLDKFRGSKYVQSFIGDTYQKVRDFLKEGRKVLFSGTPCQVAGLNHFLGKKYENLYTIDVVCHSIPSPLVWKMYLENKQKNNSIKHVTFRDKSAGWRNYGLTISNESQIIEQGTKEENLYMRGFLENLTVRPSCFACPARNYTSGSDIMLADCWGLEKYHPEIDDNRGMSQALILTEKGQKLFDDCQNDIFTLCIPYEEVEDKSLHLPITASTRPHPYRDYFFANIRKQPIEDLIIFCLKKGDLRSKRIANIKKIGKVFGLDKIYRIWKDKGK